MIAALDVAQCCVDPPENRQACCGCTQSSLDGLTRASGVNYPGEALQPVTDHRAGGIETALGEAGALRCGQFACPVVSAATGFHGDLSGRELLEEKIHLRAAEIDPQHRPVLLIDAVLREDGLGRVDADAFILGHGRLRSWLLTAPILACDAVGPSTLAMCGHQVIAARA